MSKHKNIPDNWKYINLSEVFLFDKGKKPKKLESKKFKGSVPYLDIKAIETSKIDRWADSQSARLTTNEEIVIVWDGARSGWAGVSKNGALGSTLVSVKPVLVNQCYLYYFLRSKFEFINDNAKGVGIPHVDPEILLNLKFPLAPLEEQGKIVEKIDYIFEKLTEIEKSLGKIFQFSIDLKISVLDLAATGELTADKSKGKEYKLEEIIGGLKYGTSKKSLKKNEGTPILRIPNLSEFTLNLENLKYSKLNEKEIENYKLEAGDLLLIRSNGSVNLLGRTATVTNESLNMGFAGYLIRIRPNQNLVNSEFLNYLFHSTLIRNQIESISRSTSGVNNINTKEINNINVLLPTKLNQNVIVRKIETIFKDIEALYSRADNLRSIVVDLYRTVFEQAFSGNLVKNNNHIKNIDDYVIEIKEEKERTRKNGKGRIYCKEKI